jgi:hypothetical protein
MNSMHTIAMQYSAKTRSIIQPPVWFDLREVKPEYAFIHMKSITDNFNGIDENFLDNLHVNFCDSHSHQYNSPPVIFGYIPAPPTEIDSDSCVATKRVIGTNGHWLKVTTEKSGVHMIWYDKTSNNFLFWAPNRYTIVQAMKVIRNRIIKYHEFKYENNEVPEYAPSEEVTAD